MANKTDLRILLTCGRPMVAQDGEPMNVIRPGAEIEAVKRGLEGIGREIHVSANDAAALPEINKVLTNTEPKFDVLHFVGHGTEEGALCFEDDSGFVRHVAADELAGLVRDRVRILVTMACHSEKAVSPLFDGNKAVSAAVCIAGEHPIPARAAEVFSGALYSGLAQGKTLKRSFDDAVNAVRIDDYVGEAVMPDTEKTPTLYKRFVLKGSGRIRFPDVPAGSVQIKNIVEPSPHAKITRTDELFVGRNMEIAAAAQLLAPPLSGLDEPNPRIITLCGEGGIGKTRLAQAAAEWQAERGKFPGGIFEIACDGAPDARGLAVEILKGLGIAEAEGVSEPDAALVVFLKGLKERMLLVLDNLDDLFAPDADSGEAGSLLKDCLTASPRLHILATCRWPLELGSDEHAFTVEPMIDRDSVELFIRCIPDRDIQRELRGMTDAARRKALGGILRLTDGMPLCVILAARRLLKHGKTLKELVEEAAADLLKVMDAPELKHLKKRLRSLRASLDLSYNHLSESAREVFARMSFFPAGLFRDFDDLGELLEEDWKDSAEEVARYALARYDRHADRYTMLNPVREYASEKLNESGGDGFRHQASEFWAEFARWNDLMLDVRPVSQKRAAQLLNLPDDPVERRKVQESMRESSFAKLSVEEGNLTHAAEWALSAGDEAGLGIVDSLEDYLELRKRWYTKERLYRLALDLRRRLAEADPEEYLPDLAMTLGNMGKLYWDMGNHDKALVCDKETLKIYRELSEVHPDDYVSYVAFALNNMGNVRAYMGHPDEALKHYEEALGIYRKLSKSRPDKYVSNVAKTLNNIGTLHGRSRHPKQALKSFQEALGIYRNLSEDHPDAYLSVLATMLNNIGVLHNDMGHPDEALVHYEEALDIRRKLSESHPDAYMPDVAVTLNNIGNVQANMGHPDEALGYYEEALGIYRKLSEDYPGAYMPDVAMALNNIARFYFCMDRPNEALGHIQEALEIYRVFFERYPSAHVRDFLNALRGAALVYEKLGMEEKAAGCREEMGRIQDT